MLNLVVRIEIARLYKVKECLNVYEHTVANNNLINNYLNGSDMERSGHCITACFIWQFLYRD
jgi:hypothetical protein